jgi:hypothetical protein
MTWIFAILYGVGCFLLGGMVLASSFRASFLLLVRRLKNRKASGPKGTTQSPSLDRWRQDPGQPDPAEAPIVAPAPHRSPVVPSGAQRQAKPAATSSQAVEPPGTGGNGRMGVDEAKRILQARGYSVKRRRRKPQAPTGA